MSDTTLVKEIEDNERLASDGKRVRDFIDDPAVKDALRRARDKYYENFLAAKSDEERRDAQAGRLALDKIAEELAVTVQRGAVASARLESIQPTKKQTPRR